jgi:hypothetical protein
VVPDVRHDVDLEGRDEGKIEVLFFYLDIEREGFRM